MKHITDSELRWINVDFDDTICTNGGYPHFIPKKPKKGIKRGLGALIKAGYKIHIYTARPSSQYVNIEQWLREHKIPFHWIETGKTLCALYIDDKAYRFKSWSKEEVNNMLQILKK